jgi:adenine C2-methylase RlmN of 23S rRNA A2503 and tRNA A37
LLIPWILIFGYEAYKINRNVEFDYSQLKKWSHARSNEDSESFRELSLMAAVYNASTNEEIGDIIFKGLQEESGNFTNVVYALIFSIIPVPIYYAFVWVLAGFRKRSVIDPAH